MQEEEPAEQFQPTKHEVQELKKELNKQFATTIKRLKDTREPHVQSAVDVLCKADPRADSSGRVFKDALAVREAMDIFDHSTQKCSHVTQHCQTGSRIRYVCQSVCAGLKDCKMNKGTCVFASSMTVGSHKGQCGLQDSCCFKVIFSKERKNAGKQSGGDQFSIATESSIFDHSLTCSALGASSKQLSKSMVYDSPVANSMLTFCKNVNAPEIMQAVERELGAAAGPARTYRRWLHDMAQPKSMIDPELSAEYDYNFLITFASAFETWNPGSIAKIYITAVSYTHLTLPTKRIV